MAIDSKAIKRLAEAAKRGERQKRDIDVLDEIDPKNGSPKLVFHCRVVTDDDYSRYARKYKPKQSPYFLVSEIESTKRKAFSREFFRTHLDSFEGMTRINLGRISAVARANPELLDEIFPDLETELFYPKDLDDDLLADLVQADVVADLAVELRSTEEAVNEFLEGEDKKRKPIKGEGDGPLPKTQSSAKS